MSWLFGGRRQPEYEAKQPSPAVQQPTPQPQQAQAQPPPQQQQYMRQPSHPPPGQQHGQYSSPPQMMSRQQAAQVQQQHHHQATGNHNQQQHSPHSRPSNQARLPMATRVKSNLKYPMLEHQDVIIKSASESAYGSLDKIGAISVDISAFKAVFGRPDLREETMIIAEDEALAEAARKEEEDRARREKEERERMEASLARREAEERERAERERERERLEEEEKRLEAEARAARERLEQAEREFASQGMLSVKRDGTMVNSLAGGTANFGTATMPATVPAGGHSMNASEPLPVFDFTGDDEDAPMMPTVREFTAATGAPPPPHPPPGAPAPPQPPASQPPPPLQPPLPSSLDGTYRETPHVDFDIKFSDTSPANTSSPLNAALPWQPPNRPPPPPPAQQRPPPPPAQQQARPPPPSFSPPRAREPEVDPRERLLTAKGYAAPDVRLVLEMIGAVPDCVEQALDQMQKLREEGYDRSKADWGSWLMSKYCN